MAVFFLSIFVCLPASAQGLSFFVLFKKMQLYRKASGEIEAKRKRKIQIEEERNKSCLHEQRTLQLYVRRHAVRCGGR